MWWVGKWKSSCIVSWMVGGVGGVGFGRVFIHTRDRGCTLESCLPKTEYCIVINKNSNSGLINGKSKSYRPSASFVFLFID